MVAILETKGLAKRYGNLWALQGLDLSVEKGEIFGFLGPNGAGKTTFTKCVTGFVRPDKGSIRLAGIDARRHPTEAARHVGLVPDQYDFYPNLTGTQHLDYYGRLHGMPKPHRKKRIAAVLEQVRMEERADSRTKTYSHGMKQRICIAQALLHEPQLIFFDEPTNGLDPKGAYELRQMIRDLANDGTTVFLNSHVLHEVEQTCDRVAILNRGQLKAVSAVKDLPRGLGQTEDLALTIRLEKPLKKFLSLAGQAGATGSAYDGDALRMRAPRNLVPDVVARLVAEGARIQSVEPEEGSLESAFLQLTEDA